MLKVRTRDVSDGLCGGAAQSIRRYTNFFP
jgi:hypothetical protein